MATKKFDFFSCVKTGGAALGVGLASACLGTAGSGIVFGFLTLASAALPPLGIVLGSAAIIGFAIGLLAVLYKTFYDNDCFAKLGPASEYKQYLP